MLVTLEGVTKSFTKEPLLEDINLRIEENDRIGLVGSNGTGKTTLLNIICDRIGCDVGQVYYKSNLKIGFLEQNNNTPSNRTIMEELRGVFADVISMGQRLTELEGVMAGHKELQDKTYTDAADEYSRTQESFEKSGGYTFEIDIKIILSGMGFADKDPDMKTSLLSGGEKTRLELAKLLLSKPELLVLDEPTNHLDFQTLMWLEGYLADYKGAILSVSHDRYFLDKTSQRTWEIYDRSVITYRGNYSKYKILREERLQNQLKRYESQQEEIAKMRDYIARNITRASTAGSAKSRVNALERMEIIEKPKMADKTAKLTFTFDKDPVKDVLEVSGLDMTAGTKELVSGLDFELKRGEKIAVIGANGIGKTTFLRSILNLARQDKGNITWGKNVTVSYYEQEGAFPNQNNTALEELWRRFPRQDEFTVRSALARVLLQGENVFKPVFVLSGGEKAKLAFAVILMERRNTLILDEPTNHLDLATKEVLEQSLKDFAGTLLFVSHDRYLLNNLPSKIAELTPDGFVIYDGNFDYYAEKKRQEQELPQNNNAVRGTKATNPNNKKLRRTEQTQKRVRLSELEKKIADLERQTAELAAQMNDPANQSDYLLITSLCNSLEEHKQQLDIYMQEWLELE